MKEIKTVCDKCGKSVPDSGFREFRIQRSVNLNGIFNGVDLCPNCEKILRIWLDRGNDNKED